MASTTPAAIRVANVVAPANALARNSNHGSWVDVAAPGYEAAAAGPAARTSDEGTSASAASVSGVVALMLSCDPRLTPAELKADLLRTGTPVAGLDVASGRVVNAAAAVRAAGCRR
jgi:subtilase cytotoxin subunit A